MYPTPLPTAWPTPAPEGSASPESPTTPTPMFDDGLAVSGSAPDPSVAETFGELPVEPATQEIDLASIQQAQHERDMARIQAMINVGCGLTMVKCGIMQMEFTPLALASFNALHTVVAVPMPHGGYRLTVMAHHSELYHRFVSSGLDAETFLAGQIGEADHGR